MKKRFLIISIVVVLTSSFSKKVNHSIEKLQIETTYCEGNCPVFKMIIEKNRVITYYAIDLNEQKGVFEATLNANTYNKLIQLLYKTDFSNLKDHYEIPMTDHPSIILTIIYDNGKFKQINDYGERGTKELEDFYSFIFTIRDNEKWKEVGK
jgi:hypothetical protein